ncbi:cytochrome P450 [Kickxella alabastrina]|uniref:cytochrome P450 n=1 Tax=Kickxella alabastrina TaxID=61397 RepID=UPI002220E644|nr:cytochrome P450 [Kickxella alabastrina]KAI7821630.1 cytochrome P450 [Kickxella alabastrina]
MYLNSVLKEAMRKNSIVTDIRHCLSEPVQLGPYTLSKGATMSIDSWSMHYNPANFPEPKKFIPERFAEDKGADVKAVAPYTSTTFSNGSRQCSGMKFALIKQRIAMALLFLRFEWTLPADSPFWHSTPSTAGGLISPVGLKLEVKPRH